MTWHVAAFEQFLDISIIKTLFLVRSRVQMERVVGVHTSGCSDANPYESQQLRAYPFFSGS